MAPEPIASVDSRATYRIEEAEAIVREIIAAMTLRLLDAGKRFEDGALDEWRKALLEHIRRQLEHGSWEKDRPTVLAVAGDMASIAILLAHKGDVDRERVNAAFEAIKSHRRCPARGGGPHITGCWCDCP